MTTERSAYDRAAVSFEEYKERRDQDRVEDFVFISADDLMRLDEPDVRWIADDMLLAGGSSLIAAQPKAGKSTFVQWLARCVGAGQPFLGRATAQGTVLYFAFEEMNTEVAMAWRNTDFPAGLPVFVFFTVAGVPDDRMGALGRAIDEYKPALVIIDTLAYWVGVQDFNDYGQVSEALKPLHQFARKKGIHLMTVHHMGKTSESPLGSVALQGNVDTVIEMTVDRENEEARLLATKQRYGKPLSKTILLRDMATGAISLEGTVVEVHKKELEQQIIDTIGKRTMTQTALQDTLGASKRRMIAALNHLVADSILERTGEGRANDPFMYTVIDRRASSASAAAPDETSGGTLSAADDNEYPF